MQKYHLKTKCLTGILFLQENKQVSSQMDNYLYGSKTENIMINQFLYLDF